MLTSAHSGFKWIGNTALTLEKVEDCDVRFGYEEAIGFMFGKTIRDKDGVAGMVRAAPLWSLGAEES